MKKILAVLLLVLVALCALTACENKGESTEPLPKETVAVSTVEDLVGLKNYVGPKYKNFVFELTTDLDLSGVERWEPIGSDLSHAFMATFDGKGHTINRLSFLGVDDYGAPTYVAKDKGVEFVTSFASVGLFGFTKDATIKDVDLSDVLFDYYVDYRGYSYAAGLVGFDFGASSFSDIDVSGTIRVNNLYHKYVTYNVDDRDADADLKDECTTTLFLGGVVANSQGSATFTDVHSSVTFDNNRYIAFYRTRQNAGFIDEDDDPFEEGYVVDYQTQTADLKVDGVIAGGVVGQIKGGTLTNASYSGTMTLNARNVHSAGIAGATYGTTLTEVTVNDYSATSYASNKNLAGGLVADLDDKSTIVSSEVRDSALSPLRHGTAQKITVGAVFGYAASLSKVDKVSSIGVSISVPIKEATVGGVGGIMRDATLTESISYGTAITITSAGNDSPRPNMGAVVGEAEGNSYLFDVHADTTAKPRGGVAEPLEKAIAVVTDFPFYNEDGKPAIRFYKTGSNSVFVTVDGALSTNNAEESVLTINIYNEELELLKTAHYTDQAQPRLKDENPALKYLADYFTEGVGFKDDDSGAVTVEGRDFSQYEFRSGKVVADEVDTVVPVA